MRVNPSIYLLGKIQVGTQIFSGIRFSRLFIQIATFENEVVYEADSTIKGVEPKNLTEILENIFPIDFYKMEIKISKKNYHFYDGERIKEDKNVENCTPSRDIFPDLEKRLSIICG